MSRFKSPTGKERGVQVQTGGYDTRFERFQAAPENAHKNTDSKDERSIANRLAAAEKNDRQMGSNTDAQALQDPLEPARAHGNEPSRGAKIDAQIQMEEEELLRKKNV